MGEKDGSLLANPNESLSEYLSPRAIKECTSRVSEITIVLSNLRLEHRHEENMLLKMAQQQQCVNSQHNCLV